MKRKFVLILAIILILIFSYINVVALDTDTKIPFNMNIVTKAIDENGNIGEEKTVFSEYEDFIIEFTIDPQKIPYRDVVQDYTKKELVLVIDTSGSMGYTSTFEGVNKSRISIIKQVLKNFITKLSESDDASDISISFVDYNSRAKIITINGSTFANLGNLALIEKINEIIDNLNDGGGTNTGDGLRLAYHSLKNSDSDSKKYILLLTDGQPTFYTKAKEYIPQQIIHHEGHNEWIEATTKWVPGYYEGNREWVERKRKRKSYTIKKEYFIYNNQNWENSTWHEGEYEGITGYYNTYGNWTSGYYYLNSEGEICFVGVKKENINGRYETTEGYYEWVEPYDEVIGGDWESNFTYYYGDKSTYDCNTYEIKYYYTYYYDDYIQFQLPNNNQYTSGAEYALNVADMIGSTDDNVEITTFVVGFELDNENNNEIAKKANNVSTSEGYYFVASNGDEVAKIYDNIADEIIKELPLESISFYAELPNCFIPSEVKLGGFEGDFTIQDNIITGNITEFKYVLNENTMEFEANPITIQVKVYSNEEGVYPIGDSDVTLDMSQLTTYIYYRDLDGNITNKAFSQIKRRIENGDLPDISATLELRENNYEGTLKFIANDRSILEVINTGFSTDLTHAELEPPYEETYILNLNERTQEEIDKNIFTIKASLFNGNSLEETVSTLEYKGFKYDMLNPNERTDFKRPIILEFDAEGGIVTFNDYEVDGDFREVYVISDDTNYTAEVLLDDGLNNVVAEVVNQYGNITKLYFDEEVDANLPEINYTISNNTLMATVNEEVKNMYIFLYDENGNETKVDVTNSINNDKVSADITIDASWGDYDKVYIKADDLAFNRGSKLVDEIETVTSIEDHIFNNNLFIKNELVFYNDSSVNAIKNYAYTYGFEFNANLQSQISVSVNKYNNNPKIAVEKLENFELYKKNGSSYTKISNISDVNISKVVDTNNIKEYLINISNYYEDDTIYVIIYDLTANTTEEESQLNIQVSVGDKSSVLIPKLVKLPTLE